MYAFEYHRPHTLSGALADLAKPDAKALSGGMTLLPTMKQRLASPAALIDLKNVPELAGIAREGDNLVIGAMSRHAEVASQQASCRRRSRRSPNLPAASAIRMCATWARSAVRSPTTTLPPTIPPLRSLLARRSSPTSAAFRPRISSPACSRQRSRPASSSRRVSFPIPQKAAYMKFANPASRYALVGVFVAKTAGGVRVAVTGAGSNGVFRASALETALNANFTPTALDGVSVPASGLNSDLHADAEYRAHLIGVMAKRAVAAAG